jgi:D-tyrosyl-tRNA(Tyr) deacylase
MRIVLQRVKEAQVEVNGSVVGKIGKGLLILVGVHADDTHTQADYLATKCVDLRIFNDAEEKMNRSLTDIEGEVLVVSQFTLYADCSRGRRPSFTTAAQPTKGNELYEYFLAAMRTRVPVVQTGIFGAHMEVSLINDGPVTIILEQ